MVHVIISGFIFGLTLAVMLGPSFFSLLQTSINHGIRIGMYMAFGIFLSDITLVSLSFFGISQIISNDNEYKIAFGFIGGFILIFYGAYTFRKKVKFNIDKEENGNPDIIKNIKAPKPVLYVLKGFFLNLINPFLLIFWVGIMSFISAEYNKEDDRLFRIFIFFTVALTTLLSTDFLKCFIANKIKKYLNSKVLSFLNHGMGLLLIFFGVYLIGKSLYYFYF